MRCAAPCVCVALCVLVPSVVSPPAKIGIPAATINDLYMQFLDRQADDQGLQHYVDASHKGVGAAQIADELLRSKEFRDAYTSTDADEEGAEYAQVRLWDAHMVKYLVTEDDIFFMYFLR